MKPLLQYTIPYGPAPAWCFPAFEGCMYLLFVFCLAVAVRRGKKDVFYLLGALAFGLVLEYIEVISDMGYTYGRFMVMLGRTPLDIPFCIGIGWGIIIYTARLFSDGLGLPLWAAAAFDALLAINIDLSMDTVAYRLHMWTWKNGWMTAAACVNLLIGIVIHWYPIARPPHGSRLEASFLRKQV